MVGNHRSGKACTGNAVDGTPQDGGPTKPNDLLPEAATKWDELVGQMPSGILRAADAHLLRVLVESLVVFEKLSATIQRDPTDLKAGRLMVAMAQTASRLGALFGLSPLDRRRGKIEPNPPTEPDTIEELAMRRGLPRNVFG